MLYFHPKRVWENEQVMLIHLYGSTVSAVELSETPRPLKAAAWERMCTWLFSVRIGVSTTTIKLRNPNTSIYSVDRLRPNREYLYY